ncbi:hypothetical protein C8F01DRAFT_1252900 [Mycena amicta]|nr:hypothetical protein C8F01DRAFT_1252900 [Mycena amicta]
MSGSSMLQLITFSASETQLKTRSASRALIERDKDGAPGKTLGRIYSFVADKIAARVNRAARSHGKGPGPAAEIICKFFDKLEEQWKDKSVQDLRSGKKIPVEFAAACIADGTIIALIEGYPPSALSSADAHVSGLSFIEHLLNNSIYDPEEPFSSHLCIRYLVSILNLKYFWEQPPPAEDTSGPDERRELHAGILNKVLKRAELLLQDLGVNNLDVISESRKPPASKSLSLDPEGVDAYCEAVLIGLQMSFFLRLPAPMSIVDELWYHNLRSVVWLLRLPQSKILLPKSGEITLNETYTKYLPFSLKSREVEVESDSGTTHSAAADPDSQYDAADSKYDAADSEPEHDPADGRQDEIIIAVMGSTGAGKSSFIKLLTGSDTVKIAENLESETSESRLSIPPGFDDSRSEMTDTEVLKRVAGFLVKEYNAKRKLNGFIYVHRIADARIGGQSIRNMRMIKELCGTETFKNVVILTTFWDLVSEALGRVREDELKKFTFFRDLVAGGACFMRHDRTHGSAVQVLRHVAALEPTDPRIAKEMVDEGKPLEETGAGSAQPGGGGAKGGDAQPAA